MLLSRFAVVLCLLSSLYFLCGAGPSVYVMLPLTLFNSNGTLQNPDQLTQQLQQLRQAGVVGVNSDIWWGEVEKSPKQYSWTGYLQLLAILQKTNMKLKATMSFHSCGLNVGDACYIPLPQFVLDVGKSNPNIFYRDQHGHYDDEYLSLGVDQQPLFQGRTAVQLYADFMSSFRSTFAAYIPSTITHIQVGLGPAGELRYPSYQLDRWNFPGVGEFQCYDQYMLQDLQQSATAAGHPEWGHAGPNNAGSYNDRADSTAFYTGGFDNYLSPYGQFFLSWYAQRLIDHGKAVLSQATQIFGGKGVVVEAKISGIHWWYYHPSHAAELTAGYKNENGMGYLKVLQMFKDVNASLVFTCFEMRNSEQQNCDCDPEDLVKQTLINTQSMGGSVLYSGENALPRYDQTAYDTILWQASRVFTIHSFSYLRLSDTLLQSNNFQTFRNFVQKLSALPSSSSKDTTTTTTSTSTSTSTRSKVNLAN